MAEDLTTGALARIGFAQTQRAARFIHDEAIADLGPGGVEAIGRTADADDALLGLLRVSEGARGAGLQERMQEILDGIGEDGSLGTRLVTVLGASAALGDFLSRHPECLEVLEGSEDALGRSPEHVRADLMEAVGADPSAPVPVTTLDPRPARDALRVAYHRRLLAIAAADLCAEDPPAVQPDVSRCLADLADAALDAALAIARGTVEGHDQVRLAIIAMGKTGARELNYVSDVDVIYVAEPAGGAVGPADAEPADAAPTGAAGGGGQGAAEQGAAEQGAESGAFTATAAALAREVARVCADRTAEGTLWQVDANLRPEGKDGPLTRTLGSCRRYYREWAKSWEFQALLKARAAAGDRELGGEFTQMVDPAVWQASSRDSFVEDCRAMRRRVIDHIPRGEAERNVKLGPGGLRDVEFTVQMLQMVHGRTDESLRVQGTLAALERLRDGGYIGRENAAELEQSYRFLRATEHRLQLHRMRRTHVLPTSAGDRRRLARSLHVSPEEFPALYERTRRRVRALHEEIYYRPLLDTSARLSDGQVRLTPEAARSRLAAIGYRDPARALHHIEALTEGISRRAAIQRQLLPSLLEWFADGTDPDHGLLAFRRLSETIGSAHWYLGMLRDSGVAARHLTTVLSNSRYAADELEQIPEAVRRLARDEDLLPLAPEQLDAEFDAVIGRVATVQEAVEVLRRTRRREILRVAMAHLVRVIGPEEIAAALTGIAEAVLRAAVRVAQHAVVEELAEQGESPTSGGDPEHPLGIELAIIAQGSFGAGEMGYSSDADVQFVVADRGAGERTGELGVKLASQLQRMLNAPSAGADMKISADLRPEGRNGVLARTVESWTQYQRRSAETWEKQALVRARVVVGSPELATQITAVMDEQRYPAGGLEERRRREIVRMKARVESERLPRGADPARHLKLGRGTMTDVEWVTQVLVMEHAHEHPQLRVTSTLAQLDALVGAGILERRDGEDLAEAWRLAWSLRRALFLWKGRENPVLPVDRTELRAAARVVQGESATATGLEGTFLRVTRHARGIVERILFEGRTGAGASDGGAGGRAARTLGGP